MYPKRKPVRAADGEALVEASVQRSWDCPICYVPDLMRMRLAVGDTSGAIAAGTQYVETPFIQRFEPDGRYLGRVTRDDNVRPIRMTRSQVWAASRRSSW